MFHYKIITLLLIILFEPCFNCLSKVPRQQQNKNVQVEIYNGILQGKKIISSVKNVSYYAFFGIPYAQPPIGELRFRPPLPALNWTGILDTRKERSQCGQDSGGSEDCLFINVYTPYTEKQQGNRSLLPVMVWIHGGAFLFGSSDYNMYGPDYLIQHDVVVVAMNYRLGVFGFLSTADMASPGNYGLKDQIESLRWVQRNIQHFGGNPSQVTIFGESAGAASIHYLLQTPIANGLYHRAITESGSTLCHWSLAREQKKISLRVAEIVGVEAADTEELISKLRLVKFDELLEAAMVILMEEMGDIYDSGIPFVPTIEPEHKDAVILKGSYALLSSNQFNKVPLLTGFNSKEAVGFLKGKPVRLYEEIPHLSSLTELEKQGRVSTIKSQLITKHLSVDTIVHKNVNITNFTTKLEVGRTIRSFYFGNSSVATDEELVDFLSEDLFVRPIYKTVKLHSQSVPVYSYIFSYENPDSLSGKNKINKGVAHADEVRYIFYLRPKSLNINNMYVISKMVKLWTNFAKTGNPTPTRDELLDNITWPVASEKYNLKRTSGIDTTHKKNDIHFLDMQNRLVVKANPKEDVMKFWEDIYQKYPPADTY